MSKIPKKYIDRKEEISKQFLEEIEKNLDDILNERTDKMHEIKDIASILCIHPVHLSNTVKLYTGQKPCFFFEKRIMEEAKKMMANPDLSIAEIARRLTFDPSNFTKFFKRFEGVLPSQYRKSL